MKHFITAISLFPNLQTKVYKNVENAENLDNDRAFAHPILIPLKNLVSQGDKIRVTAIVTNYEPCIKNLETFKKELDELRAEIGFEYDEIKSIEIEYEESSAKQLNCFEQIIENIAPGDEIIADVTYGNKTTPIAMQIALTFAYLFVENTVVKSLVYGEVDHTDKSNGGPGFIYDVSALFYMNSIMAEMTSAKPHDPLGFIKMLLGNGGEDDGEK